MKRFFRRAHNLVVIWMPVGMKVLVNEGPIVFIYKVKNKVINKIRKNGNVIMEKNIIENKNAQDNTTSIKSLQSVTEILENRFINMKEIVSFWYQSDIVRLNIVTDTLKESSLFGGVVTSLIFATYLANRLNVSLRIITRDHESQLGMYWKVSEIHHLKRPKKVELLNFSYDDNISKLDVTLTDIFISTSWWSSYVVKKLHLNKYYIYILQEYEPIFYPNGDEQLLAEVIFEDEKCIPIINTEMLFEYYSLRSYKRIKETNLYFEPAFPDFLYKKKNTDIKQKNKLKLFFYARPNNPRNLYYTGLKLIDSAILSGLIDTKKWEIIFSGDNVSPFVFSDGTAPVTLGKLSFEKYIELIPTIDLAICLMYAPCPSYPPLDFASCGSIVLTNKYLNKDSMKYSDNIVICDSNHEDLLRGLESAIALAQDMPKRAFNYSKNNINTSWDHSFLKICDNLEKILLKDDKIDESIRN